MIELVAKRYVKALVESSSKKELEKYSKYLEQLSKAFADKDVRDILLSPEIDESKKAKLLIDSLKDADKKFVNFLKLLAEKKRVYLIPQIFDELRKQLYFVENRFEGKVYSEFDLSEKELKEIEKTLSKRVGSKIVLHKAPQKFDGIKVEVESLGIEISFSRSRIKNQIIEHILKAI